MLGFYKLLTSKKYGKKTGVCRDFYACFAVGTADVVSAALIDLPGPKA
jgi:hypothetical protein